MARGLIGFVRIVAPVGYHQETQGSQGSEGIRLSDRLA